MAKRKNTSGDSLLQSLARLGAKARLEQLFSEVKAIQRQFPDLASLRRTVAAAIDPGPAPRTRKRKRMTATQKKAISARMKRYWTARRKANA